MQRRALFLLILGLSCICAARSQVLPRCSNVVTSRTNPPELAAKIHVRQSKLATFKGGSAKRELTAQATRWFITADADYMKTGPWSTTFYVGGAASERPTLALQIDDHGNTISAKWINEKLLFVEVWWGRFAATDLILDVATGKFLYSELAHYGDLGQPCRDD